MAWKASRKRVAQFAVLAFAAGEISYAAAEVLILRSLGPSARNYPAGRRVADNTRFTLRPGDSVVVLVGGATRTLRGPGTFTAVGPGSVRSAQVQSRVQTGAVRGNEGEEVRRPANVWHVDVSQGGRACIVAGQRPTLWRPNAANAVRLTITPQNGRPQTLDWAAGQETLSWPAAIPMTSDGSYQLSWTGSGRPVRLMPRVLNGIAPDNVEAVATALIANQCHGQLDVLIATRQVPETGRGSSGAAGGAAR